MFHLKKSSRFLFSKSTRVLNATQKLSTISSSARFSTTFPPLKLSSNLSYGTRESRRMLSLVREPLESLGDSITTAVLLSWSKQPGDAVKEDDVIGIVETDKVTMDIRAKKSGVFVEALTSPGSEISVGSDLYVIDTAGTAAASTKPAPAATESEKETPAAATETAEPAKSTSSPSTESSTPPAASSSSAAPVSVPVPIMGESITQGVLAKWNVKVGGFVAADEVVASIETDKVTVEVRSPQDGTVSELNAAEGGEVTVGGPLFSLVPGAGTGKKAATAPAAKSAAAPATPAASKTSDSSSKVTAAPASKTATAADTKKPASTPITATAAERTETRVKMTRMRLRIAQRLKEAQNSAAMLTTFQEVDMTNLMEMRTKYKDDFEKIHGVKLGFMSAFVKASTATLLEIPAVNGIIDDVKNEIVYRNYCDISVAVASPTGLVVPVLRNTQKMSFADIEKAIGEYGQKAKTGSLALEDMAGGTFTITNGGVFGSLFSTPMINPPQSAILGMHATKWRAVVINGKVEARPMMYLALTYDHRLIDGREAVVFLKSVASKVEDPVKMLLSIT